MHPDLSEWRTAKRAALAIASAMRAVEIAQLPDGRKRILHAGRVVDCATWLSVYSYLKRIRQDQINQQAARAVRASGRPVVRDSQGRVIPYAEEV